MTIVYQLNKIKSEVDFILNKVYSINSTSQMDVVRLTIDLDTPLRQLDTQFRHPNTILNFEIRANLSVLFCAVCH